MADRYAVATGNWNATSTWSATDGGGAGASVPVAGDNVFVQAAVTVTLTDNAACTKITLIQGTIDADTFNVDIGTGGFDATTTTSVRAITMGSGTWTCAGDWKANSTNFTQTSEASTMIMDGTSAKDLYTGGQTFNNLRMSNTSYVRFMTTATVSGTLTIDAGKTVYFNVGTTCTAATWVITGSSGSIIALSKTGSGTAPIIAKSGGGVVEGHYLTVTGITASPVSTFFAYNSTDGGGNTAWTFIDNYTARTGIASNNVLFMPTSVLDSATVTASSAATGLPPGNVVNSILRKVYATRKTRQEWIKFNCGSATTIQGVYIGNHSFSQGASVVWQGSPGDIWNTPPLNVTLTVATDSLGNVVPRLASYFATAATYQWWRLYIQDINNDASTLDVGRIFAGRVIQPTRNIREGMEVEEIDPSTGPNVIGNQAYMTQRSTYRRLSYSVADLTAGEQYSMATMFANVGPHTPFVMATDPKNRPVHSTMYVQMTDSYTKKHRFLLNSDVEFELEEKSDQRRPTQSSGGLY